MSGTDSIALNIRARKRQRDMIDRAAELLGRSRSEFMLDAACRRAEEVILDQTYFALDARSFAAMQKLLDKPLPPNDRLRRLMATKAPWDE